MLIRESFMPALMLFTILMSTSIFQPAQAATCRAISAAQAGADAGYARDKKAAEAWSQRENQVSSGLQQCLGNISTAITVPTFGDLSGILNGIKDKICQAARDKIQDYVPSQIDPWGDLSSSTGGLVNTTSVSSSSYSPTTYTQAATSATTSSDGGYLFTR